MLAAVLTLALRSSASEESERAVGRVRMCGKALADTLLFVCDTFNMLSHSADPGNNDLGQLSSRSRDDLLDFKVVYMSIHISKP